MMIRIFSSKNIVAVLALTTMTMCNNNVDAALDDVKDFASNAADSVSTFASNTVDWVMNPLFKGNNETDTMDDSDVTLMCRSSSDECPAMYQYTVTAGGPDLPKTGCCTANNCLPAEVPGCDSDESDCQLTVLEEWPKCDDDHSDDHDDSGGLSSSIGLTFVAAAAIAVAAAI